MSNQNVLAPNYLVYRRLPETVIRFQCLNQLGGQEKKKGGSGQEWAAAPGDRRVE